ncbi:MULTISPECIES: hypothetical protein [Leptospira]|uniref:Uncharacterized protein n=1 Tax=Leptospira borgpetersenii serovar Ballum TaxID=280505 RepID=A0A0S2IUB2_LEPBO|nr:MULTISPECIES: hypothetical protein [Leptospira]ALO27242.1 hypothetical protein LBBP_03033 [Leptospira borgpetersenii serovar Ballum]ALO28584.1 hypothetical protein LBBP_04485 [Leptospira borgpetersenii serovar Ballum]MBE8160590.1 hypothetical protein [Leptospira borgpetersenii serovar Ballum]MBE8165892.1 hypothetical protein [Leptospira borgpetersenii serovar Ballum]MBE8171247.1 hypothetical protein [Leptospira borgpetersenii serovar Ballum]
MQVKSLILVGTLEKMCVFDPSYSKTLSQLVGKVMLPMGPLSGRTNLFLGSISSLLTEA